MAMQDSKESMSNSSVRFIHGVTTITLCSENGGRELPIFPGRCRSMIAHWGLAEYIARYAEDLFVGFGVSSKRCNFTFLAGRLRKQVASGLPEKSQFIQEMPAQRAPNPQFPLLYSLDNSGK